MCVQGFLNKYILDARQYDFDVLDVTTSEILESQVTYETVCPRYGSWMLENINLSRTQNTICLNIYNS